MTAARLCVAHGRAGGSCQLRKCVRKQGGCHSLCCPGPLPPLAAHPSHSPEGAVPGARLCWITEDKSQSPALGGHNAKDTEPQHKCLKGMQAWTHTGLCQRVLRSHWPNRHTHTLSHTHSLTLTHTPSPEGTVGWSSGSEEGEGGRD